MSMEIENMIELSVQSLLSHGISSSDIHCIILQDYRDEYINEYITHNKVHIKNSNQVSNEAQDKLSLLTTRIINKYK